MSNAKQKPEITAEEFCSKWGKQVFDGTNSNPVVILDNVEDIASDLRSVIRGMLIRYEEYMNGGDDYIDRFLNENWIE